MIRSLVLLATFVLLVTATGAVGAPKTAPQDDFSWMRGANYVPSYARNDVQTWMDYDPAVIDRELGYAQRLRLNTVRVFLQYAVYERDPKLFLTRFESFLKLCGKHHIRMMPVLFDSCFGAFPDLVNYKDRDWMANPGQNRLGQADWPKLEKYVRDVVGGHRNDNRIVMWDVMNEPYMTSFNSEEDRELIHTFLLHFLDYTRQQKPSRPLTVGTAFSTEIPQFADKIDVLSFHNYAHPNGLQADIRKAKEMAKNYGKPVIINEVVRQPHQPVVAAMKVLAEEKIGWCFWELMLGKTQFSRGENPIQGIVYPDGACRDAAEIAAVLKPGGKDDNPRKTAAKAGFVERRQAGKLSRESEGGIDYTGGWIRWTGGRSLLRGFRRASTP